MIAMLVLAVSVELPAAFSQSALTITVPGAVPVNDCDSHSTRLWSLPPQRFGTVLLSMENLMGIHANGRRSLADAVIDTASPTCAIVCVAAIVNVEPEI